jgi:hypothetical protein
MVVHQVIFASVAAMGLTVTPVPAQTASGDAPAPRLGRSRAEMPVDLARLNGKFAEDAERARKTRSAETDPNEIQKRLLNRARVLPGLCARYHC